MVLRHCFLGREGGDHFDLDQIQRGRRKLILSTIRAETSPPRASLADGEAGDGLAPVPQETREQDRDRCRFANREGPAKPWGWVAYSPPPKAWT